MQANDTPGPLSDLRVLDLAGPSGVYCGRLLADLGADVVRVEPPGGDASREREPFYQDCPGVERSLFHWYFNANKRGLTLAIHTERGRSLFLRLAEQADVVLETFRPGYLAEIGLGWEMLREANPRLVLAAITPFGQDGPFAEYDGSELIVQAAGGLLSICGWPDRPPVLMGGDPGMLQASAEAACGILLALEARETTGRGERVDVSQQECLPLSLMARMAEFHATGHGRGRLGDYHPGPLNGLFACSDGWADFRFRGRPGRWERVVGWLDSHGMAEDLSDDCWKSAAFRREPANQAHIDEVFQRFIRQFNREDAMELGQQAGIEVGAVYEAPDILADPQLQAREFFVDLPTELVPEGSVTFAGGPYVLSESPWQLRRRAPLLGEHNHEVYVGELGLSADEFAALASANVI